MRGFEEIQGGFLAAAPWVTGAVAATAGGWTCDRIGRRRGLDSGCRLVIIPGLLLSGAFILAAGAAQGPYAAVIFLACCLGFQQFTDSAYWAAATSVGGPHAATACGLMNTGGNVVGGLVALLVPFTAERARLARRPRHGISLCPRWGAALAGNSGRPGGQDAVLTPGPETRVQNDPAPVSQRVLVAEDDPPPSGHRA